MGSRAFTREQVEHARHVLRGWSRAYRLELGRLPRSEQAVFLLAAALLDARPVDPVTLYPIAESEPVPRSWGPSPPTNSGKAQPPAEWLELRDRLRAAS